MHPNSDSNPAVDVAGASSMQLSGGDRSSLYVNSVDHRQMVWSPQPSPQYNFTSSSGHQQQQQRFQSPPRGSYYNQNNYSSSYSTPREQSEPPSSPPRITQNEGIGASSTNLSMMSSIEESSSLVMEPPSNLKMMMLTKAASTCEEGSVKAEGREEVVDGRAQNDDFMSRVASPTREHLPLKKRKAMSKESVLLMEVDKLKEDLGKAELKIKVLEEENERLRQQEQHRDAKRSFDMSNACSSTSQLPFIPDLPGNTTSSPGKGAINQINQHEKHQHHMMKQQLHSIYRVPSSADQKLSIPQDVFIQRHHSDIGRPIPYHPYSTTTTMNTDNYDHHHRRQQQPQQSQHIHRDRIDWMPPNNNNDSSSATRTPEKKISFALSFDANAKGGSSKDSRGYNRCVSNRGRGSRPPLASRWKSR